MVSPKVAIVVLNYNTQNLLEKYLNYILATAYNNMDVWVVDNASTDNSVAFLESQFQEQIKILVSTENRGYAGGYNWALNQIEAEFYVLINSDVRVSKNWLKPLVNLAISNSNIGAIQPKILDDKNPEYFEYAGASGGYIDKWGYPFCRGRIFDSLEKDSGQYNDTKSVFWAVWRRRRTTSCAASSARARSRRGARPRRRRPVARGAHPGAAAERAARATRAFRG